MKNKALVIFLSIIMFVIGGIGGVGGLAYITLPHNEELVETSEVYYSLSDKDTTVTVASGVQQAEHGAVSVHFLELGNRFTGDCTYIKVNENIDILIDCGSKSNSIPTVDAYLKQYVTDGTLEYVIVTHAHQDHYAGFATSEKVKSIFDLYECKNIITFSTTNQKTDDAYVKEEIASNQVVSSLNITSYASASKDTSALYRNFTRELTETLARDNEAIHLTASQIIADSATYPEGKIMLEDFDDVDTTNDITLQILNNHYYSNKAESDNDYSVCTMLNQGGKHFLFTGDLEIEGEAELVQLNNLPKVDLYKAGHHGSKTSSSMELLNVIAPDIVCVCCCAGSNQYTDAVENQFPTKQFLINVSQFTDAVYVTTLCVNYDENKFTSFNGNIVIMAKRDDLTPSVYASNNTTKLKDTEWFKQNRLDMCQDVASGELSLHSSWLS